MSSQKCHVTTTLKVLGGKWKSVILWQLRNDTLRFGELKKRIPAINQKILAAQLKDLEEHGVVFRKVYPEIPPRVEYSLSPLGKSLVPLLEAMFQWGEAYGSKNNPIDIAREAKEKS